MAYLIGIALKNLPGIKNHSIKMPPESGASRPFRHLILTGPNGSGKTRIVTALARLMMQRDDSTSLEFEHHPPYSDEHIVVQFDVPPEETLKQASAGEFVTYARTATGAGRLQQLEPVLTRRKREALYARGEGNEEAAAEHAAWISGLEARLRTITGDTAIRIQSARAGDNWNHVLVAGSGLAFPFSGMADGHASVVGLVIDLLVLSENQLHLGKKPVSGLIIIDEIDLHLHPNLQREVLPLLTELFPHYQFVITTHSPFVIASVPGAMVYDLASESEITSDDLQGLRYGQVLLNHFRVAEIDAQSAAELQTVRTLCAKKSRTEEENALLGTLSASLCSRSPGLAVEVWLAREGLGSELVGDSSAGRDQ